MKNTILILAILFQTGLQAQEDYSKLDIGWKILVDPKAPAKPEKYDRWTYSAEQMRISSLILSWMQHTYIPRGCLGMGRRLGNTKPNLYDSMVVAEPLRYGAVGRFYHDLKKDANGKWIAATNTYHFMRIAVNGNVGENLKLISTAEHQYFIFPNLRIGDPIWEENSNLFGFRTNPMLAKYPHFLSANLNADASGYTVILAPGRGLPYHPIPKGEYLLRLKERIIRQHGEDMKKIDEDYRNIKDQLRKEENDRFATRMAILDRLYEKYKNRLNEPTEITSENGTYLLENTLETDIFTPTKGSIGIPVYAFDADKVAKCKTDVPQWIAITWTNIDDTQEIEKYFMKTILEKFDFDYVYNYFFDPEKVRGKEYAPLK